MSTQQIEAVADQIGLSSGQTASNVFRAAVRPSTQCSLKEGTYRQIQLRAYAVAGDRAQYELSRYPSH